MKIKRINKRKLDKSIPMYDITVDNTENFIIGKSKVVSHNSSLEGSINKLAREFNTSENLLEGEGFFGTPVNPNPAQARYTDIKLKQNIYEDLKIYKHLNELDDDDKYKYLNILYPMGLLTSVVGIAVGYKTLILPRKKEDILNFLAGKRKTVRPSFMNYEGKIRKITGENSSWLLEANLEVDELKQEIMITDLPPLMKQLSFIKKLDKLKDDLYNERGDKITILNYSSDKSKFLIKYKGLEFKNFIKILELKCKIAIKETIVFVRNGKVIQYNNIEDYLNDYKVHIEFIKYSDLKYLEGFNINELKYLKIKKSFIEFMLNKKTHTKSDILKFTKKYKEEFKIRLQNIKLYNVDKEYLEKIESEILKLTNDIIEYKTNKKTQYDKYLKFKKSHISKALSKGNLDDNTENITIIKGVETFNIESE